MYMRQIGIAVYGGSSNDVASSYLQAARQLGSGLARRGWRLVNGAGDTGIMGATCRGALELGGDTVGIAPFFFRQPGVLYDNGNDTIYTRTMRERKAFMESLSNAFIAAPGGVGTLEEFYEILVLKQLGQLDAPIVLLNLNGYYDLLLKTMNKMVDEGFVSEATMSLFKVCSTVEETFDYLDKELAPLTK
ncbi:TIGR00730 family Rossman fold protein [Allobaculum sp. JKK-2023]|uniref:LOG family protein n=1 Tax=Allobaculum sp. JKK-2023 TaxID=3108943 RepID=UPI002B052988|nr:TIGR00730 family Rossman fold protein [Allobaculum sp. JKK-2023]